MKRARSIRVRTWLLCCLFLCGATALGVAPRVASASNVQFVGNVGYAFAGNVATLAADQVVNFDAYGYSGTLRLELWAFPSPYTGSFQLGYKLAEYTLGQLVAGYAFNGINSGPILFTPPPDGTWIFTIVVTEYVAGPLDDGYTTRDWRTSPRQ